MAQLWKKIGVVILMVVFVFIINQHILLLQKSLAAGISNIVLTLNDTTTSASGNVAISFDIDNFIPQNGKVQIEFPNDFSALDVSAMTGTNLGTNPTFGTGETVTTIELTTGAGGSATGSAVTASGFTITNPSEEGFFLVQIRTYDQNDVILGMGFKLIEIGNPIDITTKVEESLTVSLDSGLKSFSPDPVINSGAVTNQATTLTIRTNADIAYIVRAELSGNKLTGSGAEITSNNNSDDYFRIGSVELNLESGSGSAASDNSIFTGSTAIFQKESGVSTNGDLVTIHYDLNTSYYQKATTYTGSLIYTIYPTF